MKERYTSEKYKAIRNVRKSIDKKKKKKCNEYKCDKFQLDWCLFLSIQIKSNENLERIRKYVYNFFMEHNKEG